MDDFIKGDTLLIKDLTDEINKLRKDNYKLSDELSTTKIALAKKEQERLEIWTDYKYYKNKCLELVQSQNRTAIAELEKVIEFAKTQDEFGFRKSGMEIFMFIDQQIKSLKGETNEQKA